METEDGSVKEITAKPKCCNRSCKCNRQQCCCCSRLVCIITTVSITVVIVGGLLALAGVFLCIFTPNTAPTDMFGFPFNDVSAVQNFTGFHMYHTHSSGDGYQGGIIYNVPMGVTDILAIAAGKVLVSSESHPTGLESMFGLTIQTSGVCGWSVGYLLQPETNNETEVDMQRADILVKLFDNVEKGQVIARLHRFSNMTVPASLLLTLKHNVFTDVCVYNFMNATAKAQMDSLAVAGNVTACCTSTDLPGCMVY